jgi:hypothetical protein
MVVKLIENAAKQIQIQNCKVSALMMTATINMHPTGSA